MPRFCPPAPLLRDNETTKLVERCDIVYSMLSTPEAASDVFFDPQDGVLAGLSAGKNLVDCATLQVEVRACAQLPVFVSPVILQINSYFLLNGFLADCEFGFDASYARPTQEERGTCAQKERHPQRAGNQALVRQ